MKAELIHAPTGNYVPAPEAALKVIAVHQAYIKAKIDNVNDEWVQEADMAREILDLRWKLLLQTHIDE